MGSTIENASCCCGGGGPAICPGRCAYDTGPEQWLVEVSGVINGPFAPDLCCPPENQLADINSSFIVTYSNSTFDCCYWGLELGSGNCMLHKAVLSICSHPTDPGSFPPYMDFYIELHNGIDGGGLFGIYVRKTLTPPVDCSISHTLDEPVNYGTLCHSWGGTIGAQAVATPL